MLIVSFLVCLARKETYCFHIVLNTLLIYLLLSLDDSLFFVKSIMKIDKLLFKRRRPLRGFFLHSILIKA